jgi:integrase
VNYRLQNSGYADSTRAVLARETRGALRYLHHYHKAKLWTDLITYPKGVRPRNITITEAEKASLWTLARETNPGLYMWMMLCSDLAIRSGTAHKLGFAHYDPTRQELRFLTKFRAALTIPVTREIAEYIERCNPRDERPFVAQLWQSHTKGQRHVLARTRTAIGRAFVRLMKDAGITRNLRLHDFRRTTAVKVYRKTRDLRVVQSLLGHANLASTVHYLDHDLVAVPRLILEDVKLSKPIHPERRIA